VSRQLEAFPCKIVRYQPYPDQRTACARGRAVGEDGLEYIVKADTHRRCVCATEWICHCMGYFVNIPVPPWKVMQMPDGTLVFGTAIVNPRLSDLEASQILFPTAPNNEIISPDLGRVLASTYSFDLFVGNPDRHEQNYIFSREAMPDSAQSIARVRAIDFDQATLVMSPDEGLPLAAGTHTVRVGRRLRASHAFDEEAAISLLGRIRRGGEVMVERALLGIPSDWLPQERQDALLTWASSPAFERRVVQIEQGLRDGTYL
jgi:hypothetical protein